MRNFGLRTTILALCLCQSGPYCAATKHRFLFFGSKHQDLERRVEKLSCAIVHIHHAAGEGTGFFVTRSGDMVTAAHVLFQQQFAVTTQGVLVNYALYPAPQIDTKDKQNIAFQNQWISKVNLGLNDDVVLLHTGIKTACYIPIGNSRTAKIGSNVVTIGYPGIDSPSLVVYTGNVSGRHKRPPLPVAKINGMGLIPDYEVLKVQMPVTPGNSGSPIINDDNEAIGVISEVPVRYSDEMNKMLKLAPQSNMPGFVVGLSSGESLNFMQVIADLVHFVHDFESPGAAYAVPLYYLTEQPKVGPQRGTSAPQ